MGFGKYHATVMLFIFILFTETEQIQKNCQDSQNICKFGAMKFSTTHIPIVHLTTNMRENRDLSAKWKVNRLIPFRPKVEYEDFTFSYKPNVVRDSKSLNNNDINDSYFSIDPSRTKKKMSDKNNTLLDLNYWNKVRHEVLTSIKPTTIKSSAQEDKKYLNISLKPHQIKRKSLFDFFPWDKDNEYLNLYNYLVSKAFNSNQKCDESKITKVLFANNITSKPHYNSLTTFNTDSSFNVEDYKSQFNQRSVDEKRIKEVKHSGNKKSTLPNKFNDILINDESSTKTQLSKCLYKISTAGHDFGVINSNVTERNMHEATTPLPYEIQEKAKYNVTDMFPTEPVASVSNADIFDLKKEQTYGVPHRKHNEIKFNKRSLNNVENPENGYPQEINSLSSASSIANDKVKFFEIYDSDESHDDRATKDSKTLNFISNRNYTLQINKPTEPLYQSIEEEKKSKRSKLSLKKREDIFISSQRNNCCSYTTQISENQATDIPETKSTKIATTTTHAMTESEISQSTNLLDKYITKKPTRRSRMSTNNIFNISTKRHRPKSDLSLHKSFKTSWAMYPFIAAYIHEPLQIHCEAASISAHWLIAAASCMSRMYSDSKDPLEGRSAYVSYCSNEWWKPELMGYVKYSVIHPQYNHRDDIKRRFYNIGLIRLADSMASGCARWAPVNLITHQIINKLEGAEAIAIGWGLDRITPKQFNSGISTWTPLSTYTGRVFSGVCPGNIKFANPKSIEEELSLKQIYCLSLPPYEGEATDPTHGSLLFLRNKLIGLYLQEERRVFGEQSAVYTGIWKLLPWVFDTAKEPENKDQFSFDMI